MLYDITARNSKIREEINNIVECEDYESAKGYAEDLCYDLLLKHENEVIPCDFRRECKDDPVLEYLEKYGYDYLILEKNSWQ